VTCRKNDGQIDRGEMERETVIEVAASASAVAVAGRRGGLHGESPTTLS